MITSTTHQIEGRKISRYCGLVSGEAIMGANIFRDFMADISDVIGGRVGAYEKKFEEAKRLAIQTMIEKARSYKASAIVGVAFSYQSIGDRGSILMVATTGTAVIFEGDGLVAPASQLSIGPRRFLFNIEGQEIGPYDEEGMTELFSNGTVSDETSACIWMESGEKRWKPLGQILGS